MPVRSPELVGRDSAVGELVDVIARARASHGRMAFVVGEAGVGKSRLVQEALARAGEQQPVVLMGRCVPGSGPFRAIAEALHGALRSGRRLDDAVVAPFRRPLALLAPEVGAGDHEAPLTVADLAVTIGEAVLQVLASLSDGRGCVLLLEDLHWADPDTLGVVEYLADNVASEPLACVATVRSGDAPRVEQLVLDLRLRRAATVVELDPLPAHDVARLARGCLDGPIPAALEPWLRDRADGLPLLVEELLATLISSELLARDGSVWRFSPPPAPTVPDVLIATVERRLVALADDERLVIEAAALLGRDFDWALLPAITGLPEASVARALSAAVELQLVIRGTTPSPPFRFRHALTREALVARLLAPDRQRLAGRAAEEVERAHPGLPGEWAALHAELWDASGRSHRAAGAFLALGRRSLSQGALGGAQAALERARHHAAGDQAVTVEVLDALAAVYAAQGDADRAAATTAALIDLLSGVDSDRSGRVAEAHLRLAAALATAERWPAAEAALARARTGPPPPGEPGWQARVEIVAGGIAWGRGRPEDAATLAASALGHAEADQRADLCCDALQLAGRCWRQTDPARAEAAFARAEHLAAAHGLTTARIRALHELGTIDLMDHAGDSRLRAARDMAWGAGMLATTATIDVQLAACHLLCWEPQAVLDDVDRSVHLARRLRLTALEAVALSFAVGAHAMLGHLDDMRAAMAHSLSLAGDQPDVVANCWGGGPAMVALLRADRPALIEALREATIVFDDPTASPSPYWGLWALLTAVEGLAESEHARRSVTPGNRVNRGFLAYTRAVERGRAGRAPEALEAFAQGEADLAHVPRRRHLARLLVAEAAIRDGWGAPVAWVREALSHFDAAGHTELVTCCKRLLRSAGVPVPRRGRGEADVDERLRAAGVTSREADVLALVNLGLTNAEIAERLYLSPRTVETHVASLLRKTGTPGRRALAALAAPIDGARSR